MTRADVDHAPEYLPPGLATPDQVEDKPGGHNVVYISKAFGIGPERLVPSGLTRYKRDPGILEKLGKLPKT